MIISTTMLEVRTQLVREGFAVTEVAGGVLRVERADMDSPVFAAATLSDERELRGVMAALRRKTCK